MICLFPHLTSQILTWLRFAIERLVSMMCHKDSNGNVHISFGVEKPCATMPQFFLLNEIVVYASYCAILWNGRLNQDTCMYPYIIFRFFFRGHHVSSNYALFVIFKTASINKKMTEWMGGLIDGYMNELMSSRARDGIINKNIINKNTVAWCSSPMWWHF